MVNVLFGERALTYGRNVGWTAVDETDDTSDVVIERLTAATQRVELGYMPEVTNARLILTEALGPTGWEIISYDPEPIDPDVVY